MKTSALNLIFPSLDASILFTSKIAICGWRKKKKAHRSISLPVSRVPSCLKVNRLFFELQNRTRLATLFWKSHGLTTWLEDMPISLAEGTEVLKKLLGTKVFKEQEVLEA